MRHSHGWKMLGKPLVLIAIAAVVVFGCPKKSLAAMPEVPAAAKAPTSRTMKVAEPIFKGEVFISESGIGNSADVILIHGIGEELCSRSWDSLVPELSQRYHVITFDLPGMCRSSKENALYSPERYADFVKWLATTYAKGKCIIIGHSMGGAIALRFVAKYPDDVARLIVVDAAGILHRAAFSKHLLQVNPSANASPLKEAGSRLANLLSSQTVDRIEYLGAPLDLNYLVNNDFLRRSVLGADPLKVSAIALMHDDFSRTIDSIRTPTLIIWGEEDGVAPLRTGKLLQAKIPGARLEVIEKADHTPMLSRPERFNRIVSAELSGVEQGQKLAARRGMKDLQGAPVGKCDGQSDVTFSGPYKGIEINDCARVRLVGVTAEAITIANTSDISMENSAVSSKGVGIRISSSELVMTDVAVKADVAIVASNSILDLAGVELDGTTAAATTTDSCNLFFSAGKVHSPNFFGPLHGLYTITKEKPL